MPREQSTQLTRRVLPYSHRLRLLKQQHHIEPTLRNGLEDRGNKLTLRAQRRRGISIERLVSSRRISTQEWSQCALKARAIANGMRHRDADTRRTHRLAIGRRRRKFMDRGRLLALIRSLSIRQR
ncbi:hypothetical protein D3C87_1441980 [compost metagenome]